MMLFLYFCFIHYSLLIPGYAAVDAIGITKDTGLKICLAYVSSLLILSLLATIAYILPIRHLLLAGTGWIFIMTGSTIFFKRGLWRQLMTQRFVLLCFLLMTILSLTVIHLSYNRPFSYLPDPSPMSNRNYAVFDVKVLNVSQTNANDNSVPYRQAQFFLNRSNPRHDSFIGEWGVNFFQRTPLMGAVTSGYYLLLRDRPPIDYIWSKTSVDSGKTFQKFQVIAQVLNGLLILPAFFLILRFFGRKTAQITLPFIVTSHFFIYNSYFSWPKSLVAFFILLSWWLILNNGGFKTVLLAGLVSGLAYLTHDLSVLYIATSSLVLIYARRWRDIALIGGICAILAAPWILASSLIFKRRSTFILYPFSTTGIPQSGQGHQIIHDFLHTSPLRLLRIRLGNLLYLLSPYQLFTSEGGSSLGRRLWSVGLFPIPGAVGIGLLIPAYLGQFLNRRNINYLLLCLAPTIFSVLVIGWPKGLGALHFAEASVILIMAGATNVLLQRWPRLIFPAFCLNILNLAGFVVYSFGMDPMRWFENTQDIASLVTIFSIVILCGYLIIGSTQKSSGHSTLGRLFDLT